MGVRELTNDHPFVHSSIRSSTHRVVEPAYPSVVYPWDE